MRCTQSPGTRGRLVALALLALFSPGLAAQSSSESYTLLQSASPAASGQAASAQYQGAFSAGLTPAAQESVSANFQLRSGMLTLSDPAPAGPPKILAVQPAAGHLGGGDLVKVMGVDLVDEFGASLVKFDGALATPVASSSTELQVLTPAGLNALGGAAGLVDVEVSNLSGSDVAAGAFLYCGQAPFGLGLGGANTATLSSSVEPVAGSTFSFELSNFNGSGNAFLVISMQSANLPAFGGTLLADFGQSIFGAGNFAMVPVVGGMGQYGVSIPPAAAGVSVYGQAAMFDAGQPAGIALSNGLQVTVCP